jgi:hypothetical protein
MYSWETDEVIARELYTNLALAMMSIFVSTTVFIGNLVTMLKHFSL